VITYVIKALLLFYNIIMIDFGILKKFK